MLPVQPAPVAPPEARAAAGSPDTYLRLINDSLSVKASAITPASISAGANAFMKQAGMIRPGEERNDAFLRTTWAADKVVRFGDKDLVVMNLNLSVSDGANWHTSKGDTYDVIAVSKTPAGYRFSRFEDAVPMPASLTVGIGEDKVLRPATEIPKQIYYVKLTGKSVAEALKQAFTKTFLPGFSGQLIKGGGGKAPFDPTPGRTWQVKNPTFNLRRGSSAEILDVYAAQLDRDFKSSYEGAAGKIAPWSSSIRSVLVDGKWRNTMPKTGRGTVGGGIGIGVGPFAVADDFGAV